MGLLSSPRHHQSNDRRNLLAVLKAVIALFPTAAQLPSWHLSHKSLDR